MASTAMSVTTSDAVRRALASAAAAGEAGAGPGAGGQGGEQLAQQDQEGAEGAACLLYTSPSPRDKRQSRMPSSA